MARSTARTAAEAGDKSAPKKSVAESSSSKATNTATTAATSPSPPPPSASSLGYHHRLWPQLLGVIFACTAPITGGMLLALPASLIPDLQAEQEGSALKIDLEEGSWLPTVAPLVAMVFGPLGGIAAARFGRRLTIMASTVPAAAAWITMALAENFGTILVGRCIGSLAPSLFLSSVGVYVSEISHPHYRGSLGAARPFCHSAGMLLSYTLGYFFHYRTTCWIALSVPAITLVTMAFQHETPFWLVDQGRHEEAKKALQYLRGRDYDIDNELKEITDKWKEQQEGSRSQRSVLHLMRTQTFLVPFVTIGVLFILVQWMGISMLSVYTVIIFREANSSVDARLAAIMVGAVRMCGVAGSAFLVHKFPRRTLFLISSGTYVVLILAFATSSLLAKKQIIGSSVRWLPLLFAVLALLVFCLGVIPVTQVTLTEIYPTSMRSIGVSLTYTFMFASLALSAKMFPFMLEALEIYGVYYLYSAFGVLFVAWSWAFLPENKGQSLVKTAEKYEKGRIKKEPEEEGNKTKEQEQTLF